MHKHWAAGQKTDTLFRTDFASPYDLTKPLLPQIPLLENTPFHFVDSPEKLEEAMNLMRGELELCPVIAVDLEFSHCNYQASKSKKELQIMEEELEA